MTTMLGVIFGMQHASVRCEKGISVIFQQYHMTVGVILSCKEGQPRFGYGFGIVRGESPAK